MTDDLERQLRAVVPYEGKSTVAFLCHKAADAIARLRAENEALREALKPVADVDFLPERSYQGDDVVQISVGAVRRARTVLKRIEP